MAGGRMHDEELPVDDRIVRDLIASQFPQWAGLPIQRYDHSGTDNVLYRLGDQWVVRLPRLESAGAQATKEHLWLPLLAPLLPLRIPVPVAQGLPSPDYPWRWSVYKWLPGGAASLKQLRNPVAASRDLARFVVALQAIDTAGGPGPGDHNAWRGCPLALRDSGVRAALADLVGLIDTNAAGRAWELALDAGTWDGPPVWIHGDLHSGNLLAVDGELTSVIDFGLLGVGDPACDVMVAWTFLSATTRSGFRDAIGVNDATWARGRGWALSMGLIALPYYLDRNPSFAAEARRWIEEVLADL